MLPNPVVIFSKNQPEPKAEGKEVRAEEAPVQSSGAVAMIWGSQDRSPSRPISLLRTGMPHTRQSHASLSALMALRFWNFPHGWPSRILCEVKKTT